MIMLTCYTELDSVMNDEFDDSNMNISEIEDGEKTILVTTVTQTATI